MTEPTTYLDICYDSSIHRAVIATSIDKFDDEPDILLSCLTILDPNDPPQKRFGARLLKDMLARSAASADGVLWVVGKFGEVWMYPPGEKVPVEAQLPDSGIRNKRHLGPPACIRLIAGVPYVCGYAGQVYTLRGKNWVHMDAGIVEPKGTTKSIDLEGLHGTGPDDIYVAGSKGLFAHFDGKAWTRIPLQTKAFIGAVRCLSRNHVVAVGDKGTFVEGDGRTWSVTQIPGHEDSLFSDIEIFNNEMYAAHEEKLLVRHGNRWSVVDTGLKEPPEFVKLAVGDGRLWAMGLKRLHSFDGRHWEAHIDPDNG